MIKSVIFTAKLDNINCMNPEDLIRLIERVGGKIAEISPNVSIDPNVQIEEVKPELQDTAHGKAYLDGYMKVEKKSGEVKYFYNVNGESHEITEETYNKAHNIGNLDGNRTSLDG